MKPNFLHLEKYRLRDDRFGQGYTRCGAFIIPVMGVRLCVIAHDGIFLDPTGWEHVSVRVLEVSPESYRCPTWEEMCAIKDLFWMHGQWVVQFHPSKKDNVNLHPFVLHLWRPIDGKFPQPPSELV